MTTPVNETVTLNCDTSHRSYELIEWRRNDTKTPVYLKFRNYEPEIGPSYSKRVSLVNGKDLQIQHVTLDDQSVYTCKTMKNIRLIKSLETGSYIRLTVQGKFNLNTNSQNYTTTGCSIFGPTTPEHSTPSPRLRTGVHAHNKPHNITTGGYSEDLRWLVIYIWPFKGYSKMRTVHELSVRPHYCGEGQKPQLTKSGS